MTPMSRVWLAAALCVFAIEARAQPQAEEPLADRVAELTEQLGAGSEAERRDARRELIELSGSTAAAGERLLKVLPKPSDGMPAAVREALGSLRKQIADRVAELGVTASRVSIDVVQEPLSAVLAMLEEQTGNRVIDLRERFGQQPIDRPVTLRLDDAPYLEALDQVLDEAGLGVYAYSGEAAIGVVGREAGASPRWSAAAYPGPLRVEPIRVTAARDLRRPLGESLNVQLEVSWEPRIAPIALSHKMSDVEAENENGEPLAVARREQVIDLEVQPGAQATEITLPMRLPPRDTDSIAELLGTLQAIVPGRRVEFRFDKLDGLAKPVTQREGNAAVTLREVRKNNEIWELHMRLEIGGAAGEGSGDAFASHRGWVFVNRTHLVAADGAVIDHAGFETTMQRGNEIGIAYLFELPDGPKGLTWVYETPTAIVRLPVEYELSHIPLP